ncbi:NACHT, LRR and PYD domains-containing protein 1 [Chelonia mydas]|uniref:NACHT, LRR and PYD domains-containing protein 1 n=1 Tax=Chelonia mydas TaxID=8469 RepID=M7B9R6_CHEMY|nr:NACHT, LRR and PYD domains-containing protein 1 [Chelonia mydas]
MARKALEELEKAELQSVKGKWSGIQRQAGYYKTTDQSRRENYGREVLRIEDQGPTSEILIPTSTAGEHFAKQQKGFFPYAASSDVWPQLPIQAPENKPHQMITVERTDPEKMRKLYELIPNWDSWFKGMFYWALKLTNRALVEELEGGHFVEWHQEQLIKRASLVDEVLALLYGDVLDNEQYMEICTEPGKMRKLYELVPNWDTERKDRLYQALKETNRALIDKLEEEHFVKRHREQLIQRVSSVDKVLGLLRGDVLNYKQYQSISSERSDLERMWKLFELVPSWEGEHFVKQHQKQLIQQVSRVDEVLALLHGDVLDDEQYRSIRTDPVRMRKLYKLVPSWDSWRKDQLYQALKATDGALIEELEGADGWDQELSALKTSAGATGEHFVERHQKQLIERVSSVDKVLDLLRRDVLEPEMYRSLRTNPETMRRLYELVQTGDRRLKDRLYQTLKKRNRALVEELEGEHFVDRHREQLIQRVSNMDKVLLQVTTKPGQCGSIRTEDTDSEKMRKLYELVPSWNRECKDRLHKLLKETNRALIKELEEGHFADWHREQLIQRASNVEALCRKVLSTEQCQSIVTDPLKMWKLYKIVPSWDTWRKDRLYQALKETNRALVEELEGKHFVDRHREQLIQRVSQVNTVLNFLHGKVLNRKQYQNIRTKTMNPEIMWRLYDNVELQGFCPTPTAANRDLIGKSQTLLSFLTENQGPSANTGFRVVEKKRLQTVTKSTPLQVKASPETQEPPQRNLTGCPKRYALPFSALKDPPEEIHPETVQGPDGNQEMYRVHLPRAGSFRCSETELGFEVIAAVTIQYGYDSWDRRLSTSEKQQWMVSGPLFNIRVEPARAVAAVHLPHFLCLAAAEVDISQLQVAHFVDGGMTLESPTRVRPFHAVLENPSFSPIGLLWKQIYSKLFPPIHTLVLLYRSSRAADVTLHLYLIPSDLSLAQAIEDNEMKYQSIRVRKPSKSKPLRFGSCSFVSSPSEIEVTPKELEFSNMAVHPLDPDMEIYTRDLGGKLELSLVEKKTQQQIWETTVRPGDVKLPGSTPTRAERGGEEEELGEGGDTEAEGGGKAGTGKHKSRDIVTDKALFSANIQDKMPETLRDALQETLDELGSEDIKRFKSKLNHMELPEGYKRIPNGKLEEADPLAVRDLLVQYYKMDGAVEVAIQALKGINQNELAGKLETDTSMTGLGSKSQQDSGYDPPI